MSKKLLIVSFALFLLVLPLSSIIDFPQNDDWVFRSSLQEMLQGNFSSVPVTLVKKYTPTFFVQGLLSLPFANLFGLSKIAIFTLIISVINFSILGKILIKHLNRSEIEAILLSLMIFFNPLYFYEILGYMTTNYLVFFMLLAIYFILENKFLEANVFLILGFFVRQFSLFFMVSYSLFLLLNKKFKLGIYQLVITITTYGLYHQLFVAGRGIEDSGLNISHLTEFKYAFTVISAVLMYLLSYLLPVIIISFKKIPKLPLTILSIAITILFLSLLFSPSMLYSAEFPYFGNTVDRTGFLTRDIAGIKTHFYGMHDLYVTWNIFAKFLVFLVPLVLFINRKHLIKNYFFIFLGLFIPFLVLINKVYDRYLVLVITLFMLFLISTLKDKPLLIWHKVMLIFSVIFLTFMCYQFGFDFALTKKYVWEKADSLDVPKYQIQAGNAWKNLYGDRENKYLFSYEKRDDLTLVEEKNINFPLSFYVENKVYLYKRLPNDM